MTSSLSRSTSHTTSVPAAKVVASFLASLVLTLVVVILASHLDGKSGASPLKNFMPSSSPAVPGGVGLKESPFGKPTNDATTLPLERSLCGT